MNHIKWAWQRVIRGYDDRIFWEFDSYFMQFIPAIKEFCKRELENTEAMEMNFNRKEVFTETLRLIDEFEKMPDRNFYDNENEETKLWSYFGKNIGIYWN
jgi:hypothetical protein